MKKPKSKRQQQSQQPDFDGIPTITIENAPDADEDVITDSPPSEGNPPETVETQPQAPSEPFKATANIVDAASLPTGQPLSSIQELADTPGAASIPDLVTPNITIITTTTSTTTSNPTPQQPSISKLSYKESSENVTREPPTITSNNHRRMSLDYSSTPGHLLQATDRDPAITKSFNMVSNDSTAAPINKKKSNSGSVSRVAPKPMGSLMASRIALASSTVDIEEILNMEDDVKKTKSDNKKAKMILGDKSSSLVVPGPETANVPSVITPDIKGNRAVSSRSNSIKKGRKRGASVGTIDRRARMQMAKEGNHFHSTMAITKFQKYTNTTRSIEEHFDDETYQDYLAYYYTTYLQYWRLMDIAGFLIAMAYTYYTYSLFDIRMEANSILVVNDLRKGAKEGFLITGIVLMITPFLELIMSFTKYHRKYALRIHLITLCIYGSVLSLQEFFLEVGY